MRGVRGGRLSGIGVFAIGREFGGERCVRGEIARRNRGKPLKEPVGTGTSVYLDYGDGAETVCAVCTGSSVHASLDDLLEEDLRVFQSGGNVQGNDETNISWNIFDLVVLCSVCWNERKKERTNESFLGKSFFKRMEDNRGCWKSNKKTSFVS